MTVVYAILILCLIILFHEAGHFFVAKACNIKVNEFSIGMGPKLFQCGKKETKYTVRALPIGGYVQMEGEEEASEDRRAFNKKPVWQRILVVVAGAFMNLLLGFLIFVIVTSATAGLTSTTVGTVWEGLPAQAAGMQPGDRIVSVNGHRTHIRSDVDYELSKAPQAEVEIGVRRGGETILYRITPQYVEEQIEGTGEVLGRYLVGISYQQDRSIGNILYTSFFEMIFMVRIIVDSLVMLLTGQVGVSELSGPVGIVTAVGSAARAGWDSLLYLSALITVNLGVFNLLPIPALDGGKVLLLLVEAVRRKPLKPEREAMVSFIGFALLIMLMLFATYNDIVRLFAG